VLVLSFNNIEVLDGLSSLLRLSSLDVSFNKILSIGVLRRVAGTLSGLVCAPVPSGHVRLTPCHPSLHHAGCDCLVWSYPPPSPQAGCLTGLSQLRRLDMGSNLLDRLEDITALQASVPWLTELNLRGCPLADCKSYWHTTLAKLSQLTSLDGRSVGPQDRHLATSRSSTLSPDMIAAGSFAETGARVWPRALEPEAVAEPGDDKWATVVYVDLGHSYLRRLANLAPLTGLRRLNLNDNDVSGRVWDSPMHPLLFPATTANLYHLLNLISPSPRHPARPLFPCCCP
jgi:Leucine-rich repeat (LRR) protein